MTSGPKMHTHRQDKVVHYFPVQHKYFLIFQMNYFSLNQKVTSI